VEALLEVRNLCVQYTRDTSPLRVLNSVSLAIQPGESLGVVGESGAGKTVLVRTILGLLQPPWNIAGGSILFQGEDLLKKSEAELRQIRGKKIALTTPEPRKHLNPVIPVGAQIANVIQAHSRISRKEALQRAVQLLHMVGIPDPEVRQRSYPHELSGGMCQRVIIAMGLAHSPKLFMADEPIAGLDVTISLQILDLMRDLVQNFNSSLLLVSRDLGVIAHYCQRVAVMYAGRIVEVADVPIFFAQPIHPYSRRLLRAAAAARDESRGVVTSLGVRTIAAQVGCGYALRCPLQIEQCTRQTPELEALTTDHLVRCFRNSEIVAGKVAV
jgi:oligopeptide/dipeptide ABC transporter ATP-binding protein